MTIRAFRSKKGIKMVEEHWVVGRNRQLNMTKVARASKVVLRTCGTTAGNLSNMADLIVIKG